MQAQDMDMDKVCWCRRQMNLICI